ncbi:MAG: exonuclease SbcCD subunit D [Eubacteriales bacterium]|nr:exonuclease SbcCD subunit D [Eubacteriales bacterium]
MKLIHLGDLHLGKNVNDFSMIEDQKYILKEILEIAEEREVDGVLIAGDVYDRTVPSEEAVRLFDGFLTVLADRNKPVFVISGNHDSEERLQFGSALFSARNIYIEGKYAGEVKNVALQDAWGTLRIWLMPYVKASTVGHFFPEADVSTYEKAFRTVMESCHVNAEERNVLVAHQFVAGVHGNPEFSGSESGILNVGTLDMIPADCFSEFDYVALGHIHGPQKAGRDTCRYCGSPLKYSLSEIARDKSLPLVTLEEKGSISVELIPLRPLREMRHLKGKLQDLLDHGEDTDDYIYATLTDEELQLDAMGRLQEVYPNTMKLDYENSHTQSLKDWTMSQEREKMSFQELMSEFYGLIKGGEPTEEEWELLCDVAREAGVLE